MKKRGLRRPSGKTIGRRLRAHGKSKLPREIATLTRELFPPTRPDAQTQRRLEQEFRARERARAAQERAEQLQAMKRVHPAFVPCLEIAVPLWIERLRHQPFAFIEERATALAHVAACESDAFERNSKPGHAARAFNAIAEGLAALSFCPGGVTLFGLHFEAVHPESARSSGQGAA